MLELQKQGPNGDRKARICESIKLQILRNAISTNGVRVIIAVPTWEVTLSSYTLITTMPWQWLSQGTMSEKIDIVCVNELYVSEGSVPRTPGLGCTQVSSAGNRFRTTLWINNCASFIEVTRHPDAVIICFRLPGVDMLVVTYYCESSENIYLPFESLNTLLKAYPIGKFMLVGDFSAKSMNLEAAIHLVDNL